MINKKDLAFIFEKSKEYGIERIYLFGSSTDSKKTNNDIDLAVEGLALNKFFDFYSDLMFSLSKPVDLVDLNKKNLFNSIILKNGVLLYKKSKTKY